MKLAWLWSQARPLCLSLHEPQADKEYTVQRNCYAAYDRHDQHGNDNRYALSADRVVELR